MKALIFALMGVGTCVAVAGPMEIDKTASSIRWEGSKVVGDKHVGSLTNFNGTVEIDGKIVKSAEVTVDMDSIVNDDVKDPGWNKKLVDHLKSPDFFASGTAEGKESKFVLKSHDGKMGQGEITIRGVTKPLSFPLEVKTAKDGSASAKIQLEIDRTEFGVKYNSAKFFDVNKLADKVINDKFKIDVNLVAREKAMDKTKENPAAKPEASAKKSKKS